MPLGIADGTSKIEMVDPKEAEGRLADLFTDIEELHEHPGVASFYRSLGNWPDFLEEIWQRVRPHVASTEYSRRKQVLIESAETALRDLPHSRFVIEGLTAEKHAEIRAILSVFRFRLIPDLMLDVARVEGILGGSTTAGESRFSLAATP